MKIDTLSSGNPTYWPSDPCRIPDLLDFVLYKGIQKELLDIQDNYELSSDHSALIVTLGSLDIEHTDNKNLITPKTNIKLFKQYLNEHIKNANMELSSGDQIEQEIENLNCLIHNAAYISTPVKKKQANRTHAGISFEIRELIKEKRRLRRKWQQSRNPTDKKIFNKACKNLKQKLYDAKNESLSYYLKGLTPFENDENCLWRATKYLKRPTQRNIAIKNSNGEFCKSDEAKAEVFAKHLEQTFTSFPMCSLDQNEKVQQFLDSSCQMDFPINPFSFAEVQSEINKLNNKKSPGYDSISAKIVKLLPKKAVKYLTTLYNSMLQLNFFPSQWKCAEIIMLLKPNKPESDPASHRPISLLTTFSKIFERMFARRMTLIMDDRKLIPEHQFGFRSSHGTPEQCHRIVKYITDAFEKKLYCSAAFLDIQQAFDRVWHPGLLYKIKKLFPAPYYLFIKSYLSSRSFYIKNKNVKSKIYDINAGVPQGSVLGPILFTIYTSDIPDDTDVLLATYADDTAVLAASSSAQDASSLVQNYLENLQLWLKDWNIKVNTQKSAHVTFSMRRGDCDPLYLNNTQIPRSESVKYLGLHLDRRLTWKEHIKAKRTQLNYRTKKMYWLLGSKSELSLENKVLLYKAILKPIWTYCIQLWGTASNSNIEIIQRYQSKTLRLIANAPWFVSNYSIHKDLQIANVKDEASRLSEKYLNRLSYHPNVLAICLLDNSEEVRRLKKRYHVSDVPFRCKE